MKKILFILLTLTTIVSLSACRVEKVTTDYGNTTSWEVDVNDFRGISLAGATMVYYQPSDTFSVVVKAPEKLRERIGIEVDNGILRLYDKKPSRGFFLANNSIPHYTVYVKAPYLSSIEIAGSSTFTCDKPFKAPDMDIDIAGQGTVKFKDLSVRTFKSSIAGQGNLSATLTGVDNTNVDIAGQGNVDFIFHHCKKVSTSIAGMGNIHLSGDIESLDKSISGMGDINTDHLTVGRSSEPTNRL